MATPVRNTFVALSVLLGCAATGASAADKPSSFEIQVVDRVTGRGVPPVQLRTVNDIRYYTDSAGRVAFDAPGLIHQRVFFHVSSHGYEFPKDGFGYRGIRLQITPGGKATLKIKRLNIPQRNNCRH